MLQAYGQLLEIEQQRQNIAAYPIALFASDALGAFSGKRTVEPERYLPYPKRKPLPIRRDEAREFLALVDAGKIPPKMLAAFSEDLPKIEQMAEGV